jgi:hypothetical protein
MQLGRIVRDRDRALREAVRFVSERTEVTSDDQGVLIWQDGPTIVEVSNWLTETVGLVAIEQDDYLGEPYILNSNRRSATVKVARRITLRPMVEVVVRCWGAVGPLDASTPNLCKALVNVAEQGGTYPIPRAMASALLAITPDLLPDPIAIIEAITDASYESLWAIGFSAVR